MGTKLTEYYLRASQVGGLKAKMRMAVMTLIPSDKAAELDDSPELLERFENALNEIMKAHH